ncbi:MAG: hypothetical protein BGP13_09335 [Sphingobacteriales bacterium 40-81]|nr:MAG: hypothetical protein BGP13_09335 [Sphingobacteriales bacterium 40-81]
MGCIYCSLLFIKKYRQSVIKYYLSPDFMFDILYKYLIQNRSVALPGLGTLELQKIPSISNFSSHIILPPSYKVIFDDTQDTPSKNLFQYITSQTGITEWEAIKQLNDFSFNIKIGLKEGKKITWKKVGEFSMEDNGITTLESAKIEYDFMEPVPAIRVIRNNVNHTILRGDTEVSESFFRQEEAETITTGKNRKWWIGAIVLGAIALLLIFLYLYNNGFSASDFFNTSKPVIKEAPATYR